MIVCGAALEELKSHTDSHHYAHHYAQAFIRQRLPAVFEGLIIGSDNILQYDVPLNVFSGQAMVKSKTFDSIEDMQKALPVNKDAFKRAVDCTSIDNWRPKLFLHKPPIGNNKPLFIGSISKVKDMQPQNTDRTDNDGYPWPNEEEARPACNYNGSDAAAINKQLGSLQLKPGGKGGAKWANDPEAVLSAIKEKTPVAIECPTVPSSTFGKGYETNESKETFIFAAVRLDKGDDSNDNNEDDSNDSTDDDVDEDQYY